MRPLALALCMLSLAAPCFGQAAVSGYVMDDLVLTTAVEGGGASVAVYLQNGQVLNCPLAGGLFGHVCGSYAAGDRAIVTGRLAQVDSDAGLLGRQNAERLVVTDEFPLSAPEIDSWFLAGCIASKAVSGTNTLLTLQEGNTSEVVACPTNGTLGRLCSSFPVGSCGTWRGGFPHPTQDLFGTALYLHAVEIVPPPPPPPSPPPTPTEG